MAFGHWWSRYTFSKVKHFLVLMNNKAGKLVGMLYDAKMFMSPIYECVLSAVCSFGVSVILSVLKECIWPSGVTVHFR